MNEPKILITGGYGFLGTHLCFRLKTLGFKNYHRFHSTECNLTDLNSAIKFFRKIKPDITIHLAAKCGGIGANKTAPADFFMDNMRMGINVLDACKDVGSKVVMLGSTCSYPKFCKIPFNEDNIFDGYPEETNAPYGIAKRSLLVATKAFFEQYNLESSYIVSANLFGEYDNFDDKSSHVIPAMIKKFLNAVRNKDKEIVLWGDGTPTRDFLYAGDAAEAIVNAMQRISVPNPINIGTGVQTSMGALAEMLVKIIGFGGSIIWDKSQPNGQQERCLDIKLADKWLGWRPKTKLFDGLIKTINWYKEQQN